PRVELADHPDGRHGRLAASEIRGARGMKKHLKRLSAPRSWSTPRKTDFWIVRPSAGPHAIGESVPIGSILRDMLKLCDTAGKTLNIQGPGQKGVEQYELGKGAPVLVTAGKHVGQVAHVSDVQRTRNTRANIVTFTEGYSTDIGKVFVVGTEGPAIKTPEVSA